MTDKANLRDACPHIERAQRMLEMLRLFVDNKEKLSLAKRVPTYYNQLIESVLAIQNALVSDGEYTERFQANLKTISARREFAYNVQTDKQGRQYYSIDAMLPLKEMKSRIVLGGRYIHHV